jgi:hypothetical protein
LTCRLFLGESFPELQRRLWLELESTCESAPLAAKWLVVSNRTLVNHIRVELARRSQKTTLAGIRVMALPRFLAHLAGGLGMDSGSRWHAGLNLLLCQLTSEIPQRSSLRRLVGLRNGFTLLRPVLLDLADSGLGIAELETLADLADDAELRPTEKDLIAFYITWLLALEKLGVHWQPLVEHKIPEALTQLGQAGLGRALGSAGQWPQLFFYGFYDFNDNAAQIISTLSRFSDMRLFLPYSGTRQRGVHPAFGFVRPALEDLKTRIGASVAEETVSSPEKSASEVFFLATFPAGDIPEQPEFLTFQRAAGLRAEVLSAAVRIRRWIDEGMPPEKILVLAPDAGPYLGFVEEAFADFGIPFRVEGAADSGRPASDARRMLGLIWRESAPVEWILGYFRDYPDVPVLRDVNLDAFETKVRSLALSGGEGWVSLLRFLESTDSPVTEKAHHFRSAEKDLIRQIVRTWVLPQGEGTGLLRQSEVRCFLGRLQSDWLADGTILDDLVQGLDYTSPKTPIPLSVLQDWLMDRSAADGKPRRLDRPAVRFVPMMQARGITATAAVVLGLAAGRFPFRVEEDPFLSDRSRTALAHRFGDLGHRLPVKSSITDEMKLLFLLLNSCVEQVHWVIPETDETGRTVAPTPWVQRYLRHWEGQKAGGPTWPRMPRGPAEQARLLFRLEPRTGSLLPPSLAVYADPVLLSCGEGDGLHAYLVDADGKRDTDPAWNGLVPEASFPRGVHSCDRLRVTDLENLARCPFRFYARTLLCTKGLNALEGTSELDSMVWGTILHALLQSAVEPTLNRRCSLKEIADSFDDEALQTLFCTLPADLSLKIQLLPPLFAREARNRLLSLVRRYFDTIKDQAAVRPVGLERRFSHPFPGMEDVHITGQVDRIDQSEGDICIIDYKSGRKPQEFVTDLKLGYRLQPLLYPWLYSRATGRADVEFAFIFLAEDPPEPVRAQTALSCDEFFADHLEILRQGAYLCFSKEAAQNLNFEKLDPCRYCDFISLCRRYESTAPKRSKGFFERLLVGRLERLREIMAEGGRA